MKRFTVTGEHIALLRHAVVGWHGYAVMGAPAIDQYAPYGSTDVFADIAALCNVPPPEAEWPDEVEEVMRRWHRETETALQIFLCTGSMELGEYEALDYTRNWRKVPGGAQERERRIDALWDALECAAVDAVEGLTADDREVAAGTLEWTREELHRLLAGEP